MILHSSAQLTLFSTNAKLYLQEVTLNWKVLFAEEKPTISKGEHLFSDTCYRYWLREMK